MTNDKKVYKYPVFIRPKKPDITEIVAKELGKDYMYGSRWSDLPAGAKRMFRKQAEEILSLKVNGKTIKEILEEYKGEE